jgi:hypothetical protein
VDRVRRLTANAPLALRMGNAGRQRMAIDFSDDIFYRRVMDVYEDVVRTHHPARSE